MSNRVDWSALNRAILDGIDVESAYRGFGVDITGNGPNGSGWLACRAVGREDANPSACIGVFGSVKGRYKDAGTGVSLNLWEAAVRWGSFHDWREARAHFARQAGVKLPSGSRPTRDGADSIDFLGISEPTIRLWAGKKSPVITAEACLEAGAVCGRWPAKAPAELSNHVIAFPAYGGPHFLEADPFS
jgi:hypothetical protein